MSSGIQSVLPTSIDIFREEKGRKLVRAISAESIYRCMLLFLDHILYRRAHFVRDELRASRAVLAIRQGTSFPTKLHVAQQRIRSAWTGECGPGESIDLSAVKYDSSVHGQIWIIVIFDHSSQSFLCIAKELGHLQMDSNDPDQHATFL